eukprot:gnl/Chilomastix_caulleri/1918.p1 GENE.gnl/Chilomastix_caulleri/1918~~gnl/Chilomastix_caulleri/1918.p1  ORF type:complete len:101 (+),score=18.70 gnl/Chilomastix_caulleri/1918:237-539(+)
MLLAMLSNISETDGMLPPFASHIEFIVKERDDVNCGKEENLYLAVKFNHNDVPILAGDRHCEREYKTNNIHDGLSKTLVSNFISNQGHKEGDTIHGKWIL